MANSDQGLAALLQAGDSPQLRKAITDWYNYHAMGMTGTDRMAYITKDYGAAIANQVRQRVAQQPALEQQAATQTQTSQAASAAQQQTVTNIEQQVIPMAGQPTAPGSSPFAASPQTLTAQDLVTAGLVPDLSTAQTTLNAAKGNAQFLAGLAVAVTNARQQQYLTYAGIDTNYADRPVQLIPAPAFPQMAGATGSALTMVPGGTVIAGALQGLSQLGQATGAIPSPDQVSTTYADALQRPSQKGYDVAGLQSQLVSAGLLAPGTYHPGVYDPNTITAYGKALAGAMQGNGGKGVDVSTYLGQLVANPTSGAGATVGPEPRADPVAVTDYVNSTFQKLTGRLPSTDELNSYIADYRKFEDGAYQSSIATAKAQSTGAGGQVYSYNPQNDVAAEIAQSQPAQLYGFEPYAATIDKVLGK